MLADFLVAMLANIATRLGFAKLEGLAVRARWSRAESSIKTARKRVHEVLADVNTMAGNRDDVLVRLAGAGPELRKAEEAVVAARRECEDIDRRREQGEIGDGTPSRLQSIWDLVEKSGDNEQGDT